MASEQLFSILCVNFQRTNADIFATTNCHYPNALFLIGNNIFTRKYALFYPKMYAIIWSKNLFPNKWRWNYHNSNQHIWTIKTGCRQHGGIGSLKVKIDIHNLFLKYQKAVKWKGRSDAFKNQHLIYHFFTLFNF